MESNHINKNKYDDATGRFVPYVVRDGDSLLLEPLPDYEGESEKSNFYQQPKQSKSIYWSEPISYTISGKDTLLVSIVLPLLDVAEETGKAAELIALTGQDVAEKAGTQMHELQETSRAMNEISTGIGRIAQAAADVTDSSRTVAERTTAGTV